MSEIKLIAVDLDGTLLKSDHTISNYTLDILKKIKKKNIQIVPTTGRPFVALKKAIPINIFNYFICTNGVHIYQQNNTEIQLILDRFLSYAIAEKIFSIKEKQFPKMHMHCYDTKDTLYAKMSTPELEEYTHRTGLQVTMIDNWNVLAHTSISKIMCVSDNKKLKEIQSIISHDVPDVTSTFSMLYYLEIFKNEASKANALLYIIDKFNIKIEQILAIGDSYNDISMLELCTKNNAYVMKNAPDNLAPHLPRTQYNNEEDGVAKLLEKLFL